MHVRGFTRHPNSGVAEEQPRHVRRPDREDPVPAGPRRSPPSSCCRCSSSTPRTARPGVVNYWGYQPVSFFAPHHAYSSRQDPLGPVDEFRDMVKALHRAGIEVILDVVFNHTAEGDDRRADALLPRHRQHRPTTSSKQDRARYAELQRLRQHAQRQPPDRPPDDRGQPALLGAGDARGRLPVRPGVDPGARRLGPA